MAVEVKIKIKLITRKSILGEDLAFSIQIRLVDLLETFCMKNKNYLLEMISEEDLLKKRKIEPCILFFNKTINEETYNKLLKNRGHIKIIYDLDDLIPLWPSYSKYTGYKNYSFEKYYNLSHIVSVPNTVFKSNIINLHQKFEKIEVMPTYINYNKYIKYKTKKYQESNKILYSNADLIKLTNSSENFQKALSDISFKYKLELINIGDVKFEKPIYKMQNVGRMNFFKYMKYLIENDFKFAVIPLGFNEDLLDDIFNSSKSPVKYQQYAISKIPCIFSNSIVYSSIVDHNENGLLVENDYESWFAAMEKMVLNFDLRRNIAEAAFIDVMNNQSIDLGFRVLERVFKRLNKLEENE
jgi:hypothetical protein